MIPMLSESLFGNWFMLQHYEPMQKMYYSVGGELTEGYVSRLNLVSKTIVETAIREHDWYPQGYLGGVHGAYESVLHDLMYRRYKDVSVGLSIALHSGIADLYKPVMKAFDKMPIERLTMLYASTARPDRWENLVAEITSIVYESLESTANSFQGHDDPNWHHAISVFQDVFPMFGSVPIGFDPLQQRLGDHVDREAEPEHAGVLSFNIAGAPGGGWPLRASRRHGGYADDRVWHPEGCRVQGIPEAEAATRGQP